MTALVITHSPAEGTLLIGDPRPHHPVLKDLGGWRYSRNVGGWYVRNSRDRSADQRLIGQTATELRARGFDVSIEITDERRTVAEREEDRAARTEQRSAGLAAAAERHETAGQAKLDKARQMADVIPLGQPILVDHYSANRDRRYRDRIQRTTEVGFREIDASRELARRADVAASNQDRRLEAGPTLRRIEKFETELRDIDRKLNKNGDTARYVAEHPTVTAEQHDDWLARIRSRRADLVEQIAYWKAHIADLEESGVKIWGPDDFTKGDRVQTQSGSAVVVRVNKKSLSCIWDHVPEFGARTLPYNKIRGKL